MKIAYTLLESLITLCEVVKNNNIEVTFELEGVYTMNTIHLVNVFWGDIIAINTALPNVTVKSITSRAGLGTTKVVFVFNGYQFTWEDEVPPLTLWGMQYVGDDMTKAAYREKFGITSRDVVISNGKVPEYIAKGDNLIADSTQMSSKRKRKLQF